MNTFQTKFNLAPEFFSKDEKTLIEHGSLSATAFRFDSSVASAAGVCALRLADADAPNGQLVMLPFQGQQVWSAAFNGRVLTMKSMFEQPYPTREFLNTFGGFLQHCGATRAGSPAKEDTHPLHGELPNAPYQQAWLVVGEDDEGPYIGLGGQYQYTVAFNYNYVAKPLVKLHAGATLFNVKMTIKNLKDSPMELMYMAHVNFKPVDNGRLVYSAPCTPEHVRVRASIPTHIVPGPGYVEFIETLKEHPEKHNILAPGLAFDPEVVFFLDYLTDEDGWAHTMQVHPDGNADYIRHRPEQLEKATRWISRTADQDAIALVEAGTCEPEGYLAEKAKGNIKTLAGKETFVSELVIGALTPEEAEAKEAHIKDILAG